MDQNKIEILERALKRERAARKEAEKILEQRSAELYSANQRLEKSYTELEALLDKTDSQLQGVFENIVDAYVIMDLMGNILKMNDAAVDLLDFDTVKDNANLLEFPVEMEQERVSRAFKNLLKNGAITDFQVEVVTRKGKTKLVHINASIIYDQGIPVAAQGIVRDVTKAKAAERQLIESENRLKALMLNLKNGVLLKDEDKKIVLANEKFCELFGIDYKPNELKGKYFTFNEDRFKKLFENSEEFINKTNEIVAGKEGVLDDELHMKNGKILERDYIPIYDEDSYKGHLWTYRDVTLRKKYGKSIEAQRQKYRGIITNMQLGLAEVDTRGRVIMVNQSFIEMSGYQEQELVGNLSKNFFSTEDAQNEKSNSTNNGVSTSYEIKVEDKFGKEKYWLVSRGPNYNLNDELVGYIFVYLDITDLKNLELQKEGLLSQLEKSNDELQEYAHIVSHDLKSPLRSISALVSWLKSDNEDKFDKVSLQNLALIETTIEKMDQLISDVLEYSSIGSEEKVETNVDLNVLINDLIQFLYKPDHVEIQVLNDLPMVIGDKTKLQQLFQNLMSNAIKFIDKEQGYVKINVEDIGTHYKFSIEDNGIGIDEKYHSKIFKVFQSVNKRKDSTGIGLSIVQKIVELHQGEIWLNSKLNEGTTFFFTIKK
ncbi:PAS domain-containing sensor histidine kinase [Seonamhaeicola marinus]|uniref:histidine kinase n=1 Tax=Seonamhaeicola marinus TaxID=1912246 RepID=A0A5D0I437_9FLAO|nr:PAS domain-containing sensor histidine kinase [Seonamhaeicola marinus]TYA78473.1 PAS domain S-box protein [Seonamhaeicola marinus]